MKPLSPSATVIVLILVVVVRAARLSLLNALFESNLHLSNMSTSPLVQSRDSINSYHSTPSGSTTKLDMTGLTPCETDLHDVPRDVARLRAAFATGKTRSYKWRMSQLKALQRLVKENVDAIDNAMIMDLGRHKMEAFCCDTGNVLKEISVAIDNLKSWMKPVRVSTPMLLLPGYSEYRHDPLGVVLVVGPFNFPVVLSLCPFMSAIAAGNCAVLKPSELAANTARVLGELIPQYMDNECIAVHQGGIPLMQALLEERWDKIFFTGSTFVGKLVYLAAAKHLTPVTLELGGKSPVFIDEHMDMRVAARRVMWAKCLNAGQVCIAPDFAIVHSKVYNAFLLECTKALKDFFGDDPKQSDSLSRIVSQKHAERLKGLIDDAFGTIYYGGRSDVAERYIEPTIITDLKPGAKVMNEEIFGPILPVYMADSMDDAIEMKMRLYSEKPLVMYIFSNKRALVNKLESAIPSGAVVVNDCIMHAGSHYLPFGGVGQSGLGESKGYFAYTGFTHKRAMMFRDSSRALDLPVRYAPFTDRKFATCKLVQNLPGVAPYAGVKALLISFLGLIAAGICVALKFEGKI